MTGVKILGVNFLTFINAKALKSEESNSVFKKPSTFRPKLDENLLMFDQPAVIADQI